MNVFVMPKWLNMANLSKVSVVPAKAGTQFVPQKLDSIGIHAIALPCSGYF